MRFLVGLDDTDSSRGYCTTYLAYRIAVNLNPDVRVLPYPRLIRLNPNIPFKTRGNAAVCLEVEARDPDGAFELVSGVVKEFSDIEGGANTGMVLLDSRATLEPFRALYLDAVAGVVNPHRARELARRAGALTLELGNGMGIVGAASALGFHHRLDHTFELIAYRERAYWGTPRRIDGASVVEMDANTFPHLYNNYDYQKRKVLIAPHGPDPVLVGLRGDSPEGLVRAFRMTKLGEGPQGHMIYLSNQHTDAHLSKPLDWKVYSSGWVDARVDSVETGEGGHVYLTIDDGTEMRRAAAYEPTGDLNRTARRLERGDRIRAYGGVRRGTSRHTKILNMEKFEVLSGSGLPNGTYVSSPRANRHLTKPLIRYEHEDFTEPPVVEAWVSANPIPQPVPA